MGWKTDWLYGLVFDVARGAWERARTDARVSTEHMGMPDIPPDSLVVYQHAGGNFESAACTGPIVLLGRGASVRLTPAEAARAARERDTEGGSTAVVSTIPPAGPARVSSLLSYNLGDDIFGRGRSHHYSYLVLYFDRGGRYIGGAVRAG